MLIVWSVLVALQGDRRLILQALMGVFVVLGTRLAMTKFSYLFCSSFFGAFCWNSVWAIQGNDKRGGFAWNDCGADHGRNKDVFSREVRHAGEH